MTGKTEDGAIRVLVPQRIRGDDAYPVWHRRPLPLDAARARYPGFRPGSELLRAGTIHREGAKPLTCDIRFERDVAIPLRDGVVIYADVFRPGDDGGHPAILSWSPYGKEVGGQVIDDLPNRAGVPRGSLSEMMKFEAVDPADWVAHGYVVVNPDTRGAYKSGGNLVYWGRQLAEDGHDVVEWAAGQAWSNGRIGLAGNSWLAVSQWFIAAERPPHLAAIAPWEGLSDMLRDISVRGGIPMLPFTETIIQTFAGENLVEDSCRMAVVEQDETPYWRDKIADVERIEVPAYVVASYDNIAHSHGTFDAFRRLGSTRKWLRVHNTHEWPDFYANTAELRRFFDHFLKGEDNGWEDTPPIRISVIDAGGSDETGRPVEAWPPAGYEPERLHLDAKGGLSATPVGEPGSVRYAADGDRPAIFRMDFEAATEIVGHMKLRLWVGTEGGDDMDLVIAVEKVDGDGNPIPRANGTGAMEPFRATGALRVSRRRLDPSRSTEAEPYLEMRGEERLAPGEIVPVEIGLWPTGMRFKAGETLQVTVAPYRPRDFPMPLGSASVSVPTGAYTYVPGERPGMRTLGGPIETNPAWVSGQRAEDDLRNEGTHVLHVGGSYDSHLLVPMRRL